MIIMYKVYILQCADQTYYIGYTTDLGRRIIEHNSSAKGARYTKSRRPTSLIYSESFETLSSALKREAFLKQMTRRQKELLIATNTKREKR